MTDATRRMDSGMAEALKIEIDIFSGRPNPVLELRGDQARQLQELLLRPRQPSNDAAIPDQLGFRGFVITPAGGEAVRVKGAMVQAGGRTYADPDREVQGYILTILPQDLKTMLQPVLDGN